MAGAEKQPKLGYEHAGLFSRVTYSFVEPLIRKGVKQEIDDATADDFLPSSNRAEKLAAQFDAAYTAVQVCSRSGAEQGD